MRPLHCILTPLVLLAAAPVFAAGGAHVIDDAAVEDAGTCHLESWVTLASDDSGIVNSSPACTRKVWPNLELGGFVAHSWSRDRSDTLIGLSPKLRLRSEERGWGIGIASSAGFDLRHSRFETASLIVPLSIPAGDRLRFNLNAGWQWTKAAHAHDLFVGAQTEIALKKNLQLMMETFTRDRGKAGGQAGLRWTTDYERMDIDLLVGRYLDGMTPTAVTVGITLRR